MLDYTRLALILDHRRKIDRRKDFRHSQEAFYLLQKCLGCQLDGQKKTKFQSILIEREIVKFYLYL